MSQEIRVAMIGLDTSHTVEFSRRMPEVGLNPTTCLSFVTPFQNEAGIKSREPQLEVLGVRICRDFDKAIAACDAVMIELNDPSLHLEYFRRCAELGKPLFLDKPLADQLTSGKEIVALAEQKNVNWFSCSPLRWDQAVVDAAARMTAPRTAHIWGPLGQAPAGSSLVWYGVHAFEMLQRVMGGGAASVQTITDHDGAMVHVDYADGRRGIVELTVNAWSYGGVLRDHHQPPVTFTVAPGSGYYDALIRQVAEFFRSGHPPVQPEETLEIMGMLDAAEHSARNGHRESIGL